MKKLVFFLIAMVLTLSAGAQIVCPIEKTTTIGPLNIALMSGTDTVLPFKLPTAKWLNDYSIECIIIDTLEGSDIGIELGGTNVNSSVAGYYNNHENFVILTDSLAIKESVFPEHKAFVGEKFPFVIGGILVDKNTVTEGSVKFLVRPN